MNEDIYLNKRIDNPKLLQLMKEIREKSSEQKMLELLTEATAASFVVPVNSANDETGKYSFHAIQGGQDRMLLVVFADSASFDNKFENTEPKQKAVSATFEDLMHAVLNNAGKLDGFILNPGTEEVVFGREMLKMISSQMKPATDNQLSAKIGDPDHYPDKLIKKAQEFGKAECVVNAIYVRICQLKGSNDLHWLFLLEHDGRDDQEALFERFERYIMPYLDGLNGLVIDKENELAEGCKLNSKAIYIKEEA